MKTLFHVTLLSLALVAAFSTASMAAITSGLCYSYKQEILSGVHTSAHTYKVALFTNAATIGPTTTAYTTTNEVTGTGYTAGGAALTGFTVSLSGSTAVLTFSNISWASSTITARGMLIYNSSVSNKAVAAFDFGSDITSTNGTFTVTMPTANSTTGLIRIALQDVNTGEPIMVADNLAVVSRKRFDRLA